MWQSRIKLCAVIFNGMPFKKRSNLRSSSTPSSLAKKSHCLFLVVSMAKPIIWKCPVFEFPGFGHWSLLLWQSGGCHCQQEKSSVWGQLMLSLPCITPWLGYHMAAGYQSGAHTLSWPVEHLICVPGGFGWFLLSQFLHSSPFSISKRAVQGSGCEQSLALMKFCGFFELLAKRGLGGTSESSVAQLLCSLNWEPAQILNCFLN